MVGGNKYILYENLELYANIGKTSKNDEFIRKVGHGINIEDGQESITLYTRDIDFNAKVSNMRKRLDELSSYYSSKNILSRLVDAIEVDGELKKIEKFSLPNIGGRHYDDIYVATYDDKIVVLNYCKQIGIISNVLLNRYIGYIPYKDSKQFSVCSEAIGSIENGILFTYLNEKQIEIRAINKYAKELLKTLPPIELERAINDYKSSDSYSEDDSEKLIMDLSIKSIATEKYKFLSNEEKQRLKQAVIESSEKFVVEMKNGVVSVSEINETNNIVAFKGTEQLLYDVAGKGLYVSLCEEFKKKSKNIRNDLQNQIGIDQSGNMIIEHEKIPQKERKTLSDFSKEYSEKYNVLCAKYVEILGIMNNLMQQNEKTSIPDFQEKLNSLKKQKEAINKEMNPIIKCRQLIQQAVNQEMEKEHTRTIFQVENLLNTVITPDSGEYEYDHQLDVLNALKKDSSILREEKETIKRQLTQLYRDKKLELNTYNKMRLAVIEEYNRLIAKVSRLHEQNNLNSNSENTSVSYTGQLDKSKSKVVNNKNMNQTLENERTNKKFDISDDMLDEILRQEQALDMQTFSPRRV